MGITFPQEIRRQCFYFILGYLQFRPRNKNIKVPVENNGGFGGGGYGSADGGAGGGGGFSGGGGGAADGFSGGGASVNNGFRQTNIVNNLGNGYVRISFIGMYSVFPSVSHAFE